MSNLRKDAFVAVQTPNEVILGVIAKMDKKAGMVTLKLPNGGETEVAFDADTITKVTKVQFNQLLSGTTLADLFQTPVVEEVAEVKTEATATTEEVTEKEPSKADEARSVFVEMTKIAGTARKYIIKAFVEVVGLTKLGANTYYYNCTKARKAGKL